MAKRINADDAYEIEYAREEGKQDARRNARMRGEERNNSPKKGGTSLVTGCLGYGALVIGLFAVCGFLGVFGGKRQVNAPPEVAAPRTPTTTADTLAPASVPVVAATGAVNRHAMATMQVSRIGDAEADVVAVVAWPAHDDDNLLVILHMRRLPATERIAKGWYDAREPVATMVSESSGKRCRQVTGAPLIQTMKPRNDECALLFEMVRGEKTAYLLELPIETGSVKASFRFRIPVSVQYDMRAAVAAGNKLEMPRREPPFTRSMDPADAESDDVAMALKLALANEAESQITPKVVTPGKDYPQPNKPDPDERTPNGTITPRKVATTVFPVAVGTQARFVEQYELAVDIAEKQKLVGGGDVVLIAEPTPVAVEATRNGWSYLRPTAGPHKGRLLVAREKAVGK